MLVHEYGYQNREKMPERVFVLDLETGKTVLDDSFKDIHTYEFGGEAYCSFTQNNESILMSADGTVLFKRTMPNTG